MSGWLTLPPDVSAHGVSCLWPAIWQGTIGLLVVWLICGLMPRMPARFQCWMWRLALLKFMVTLLWRVPLAVPLLPAVAAPPAETATLIKALPAASSTIPVPSTSGVGRPVGATLLPLLLTGLGVVWVVGVAWQGGCLIRGWLALRRFRRRCRTLACDGLTQDLRMLCKAYGVRRPPLLLEHENAGSPLLLGILRPAIIMPSGLLSALGSNQCRMALAHELAHIKRHDLAWSLVAAVVRAVFVFHPLVWWASRRLELSQEIAADQFVLTSFDQELGTYAEMLLAVANQPQSRGLAPVLSAGTVGRYQTLKRRFTAMKSFHPTSRGGVVASGILVSLSAIPGVVPWRLVAADAPASAAAQISAPSSIAKSVTVFPIGLNSRTVRAGVPADMAKNVAELVGLFLERGGVKEIEIADAQFSPPEKGDQAKVSEAFGRFVQSRNLKTEYALYGEFVGTPVTGVNEIRLIVVDRQGKVVLSELRDRQQLAQHGEKKLDPMLASYYMVCRLQGLWGLADPNRKDAPEGKMARLWNEKSGLPPKNEQQAMQSRLNMLKQKIKTTTVAVYPVRISGTSDAPLAERLAEMLTNAGLGRALAVNTDPKLQIQGSPNQTRILFDTARAFQAFLHKNPPEADYALLAAYGIGHSADGKSRVSGAQFVLCDRSGDWVLLDLKNDHHPDFQRINPQSPDDCNRLVIEAMKNDLR